MSASVLVRVPASTANLGPGFDCMGIALRIYNSVRVTKSRTGNASPMALEAAKAFFKTSKVRPFSFSWEITGDVPQSRGLGSSVTLRLGILHGLNALSGGSLDREALYRLCSELEGHPDNAAPAAYGGFTTSRKDFTFLRAAVSEKLSFILLIPPFEISTPAARKILPKTVTFKEAVANTGNAAFIAAAFFSGQYKLLHEAFEDHLHQPYRKKLLPSLDKIIAAGTKAGALGGWLSGSGSTVACLATANARKIATAMQHASKIPDTCVLIVKADNGGTKIMKGA
ncbi:MAG: homoserine kinase [Chthoniobacterales bacterium]